MVTPFEVFERQFPKYCCAGVTCTDGKVCLAKANERKELGKTADEAYYHLYDKIHVGMSIHEAYEIWCSILRANPYYCKWAHYFTWSPLRREWWKGIDGERYHIVDGIVTKVADDDPTVFDHRPLDYQQRHTLAELKEGMTLEEARDFMVKHGRGCVRWSKLYSFEPKVKASAAQSGRIRKPITETTRHGAYNRDACPPLLSTTEVDVRILYPNCDDTQMPDQVQVILYALTKVWLDYPVCKRVNPEAKKNSKIYAKFAKRQMSGSKFMKRHPSVYNNTHARAMRVTRDCCIEIDFEVKGATLEEFSSENKDPLYP